MERKSFRKLRAAASSDHHNVYVVLLSRGVGRLKRVRLENPAASPDKPCVYVGMSGLTPDERFENHKAGVKSSWFVHKYGESLLPSLYEFLNPMPYAAALIMEKELAEDLRQQGYTVCGGH
ncbi:MAG: hypothetical protein JWN25_1513 [Verrucomicrobiales bacterium]|nr:hypothetical protein [Verrucomicrobiales bacterium]